MPAEPSAAAPSEGFWLRHAPLVAAALALLVYAPSLGGGFVYDDGAAILRNPAIRDLHALGTILRYEPSRPLLNLSWALNYAVGGLEPWSYHLVNVLIHAANSALLASLFYWMARRREHPEARVVGLLGACLFAASPMAAETVAYVASRSSALQALFAFASLRVAASVLASGPRWRLAPALALFLLGLATKEEAAALPLLLVLLDYFFVARQELGDLKRRLWVHVPFLALLPLGLLARRLATGNWLPPQAIDPAIYVLTQWAAFPLYVLRALVPLDPAMFRGHAPASWPPDAGTFAGAVLGLALCVVVVKRRRAWPEWAFAVACLAAGLLPSSSLVSLNEMVVDHRAYLGSFGMAFALGGLLFRLGRLRLAILVLVFLAARSIAYERVLADPVRAWEDAVSRAPSSHVALCALGEAYAERSDARAETAFRKAVELAPGNARYWANLGVYYSERGRLEEAARALREAVRSAPGDGAMRDYLGQVLLLLGYVDEARAEFEAAIAGEPGFAQAYVSLAGLSLRQGQPDAARALLDKAAALPTEPALAEQIVLLRSQLP